MENHFYEKRRCLYFYCNLPKEREQDQTEKLKVWIHWTAREKDTGKTMSRKADHKIEKSGSAHKMPNRSFPPLFAVLIVNT